LQQVSEASNASWELRAEKNKTSQPTCSMASVIQELLPNGPRGNQDFLRRVFDLYREHAPGLSMRS